ncbi:hypothetical protein FRB99_003482 [Tulasnella sp. 403]|nr:hypothetical protein FRB99_003482 [Tulasnella sp. 403]
MICEVLCVLAGHKSSLFTDDAHVTPDFLPLLHPGEVQTLEALVGLASRFSKIRQAANHFRLLYSNYAIGLGSAKGPKDYVPSEYLSTLGAAILQVLREYEALVVKTEARVLHRDSELVGAKSFVSLSAIRAVFSIWDAPLVALDSLVDDLYAGPPGDLQQLQPVQRTERSEVPAWPPGPLIDTLLQRSRSGIHRVAEIMSQLAVAVQRLWRIHLTAFILHGSLSTSDPLAIESMTGKDAPSTPFAPTRPSSATSPKSISSLALNDRAIPSCITPQTRESILYLGKAVATVKGQGQAQKQFPRTMAVEHAAMLERVLPQDGFAFDRVISEIRATVSEFLWEHVLNERDVEEAVESLYVATPLAQKLAAPKTASTPRPTTPVPQQRDEPHNTQRRSHHDFSSLRNLHSNYLYSLLTGALLGNATYASLIRGILDVCDQFVAQVERWGGDILPGLLSEGSLSAQGSDLGRTVRERWAIVREVNETLNELLQTFYKHLSENMSLGPTSGHPTEASMLLNASTTILGLNVFRAQRESKQGNGRIERDGIAERQVEHLLLRLDYNSAISAPLKAPAEDAENLLQGDLA